MSNSTSRNGGAILFFTTFTRVRLPTTIGSFLSLAAAASLMAPMRRMSSRMDA